MSELTILEAIDLVPVIELEPGTFATRERTLLAGTSRDEPEDWTRYWLDSLADSGVVGLVPVRPASWHVTTRQLTGPATLGRILSVIVREWGGAEAFSDPDGKPVLSGGLALRWKGDLLVEPTCCGDLGNVSEWREASAYRQPDWRMVWIGHPWLSVRFHEGRLIFSEPHESDSPVPRWAIRPEELHRAVAAAEEELADFAHRLEPVLDAMGIAQARGNAQRLAGWAVLSVP